MKLQRIAPGRRIGKAEARLDRCWRCCLLGVWAGAAGDFGDVLGECFDEVVA